MYCCISIEQSARLLFAAAAVFHCHFHTIFIGSCVLPLAMDGEAIPPILKNIHSIMHGSTKQASI